jgi:hypothetical protein
MSDVLTYSKVHEKFFEEHGELIDYKKGYPLVWSNDDVPWVFFLKSGIVKTTISPSDSPTSSWDTSYLGVPSHRRVRFLIIRPWGSPMKQPHPAVCTE